MANPPITVGELVDVPAPGSSVKSAWAQEVSARVVQRFATTAARDAAWPPATAGAGAVCSVVDTLFISTGAAWLKVGSPFDPRGVLGAVSSTTVQNAIGAAAVDLTGLTVTWAAVATRWYRSSLYLPILNQTTAPGIVQALITDGAGAQKQEARIAAALGNLYAHVQIVETGLAGNVTRKGRLSTNAGAVNHTPAATAPALFTVEDIGGTA